MAYGIGLKHIIVGNGSTLPIATIANTTLLHTPFRLSSTHVAPLSLKI